MDETVIRTIIKNARRQEDSLYVRGASLYVLGDFCLHIGKNRNNCGLRINSAELVEVISL